MNNRKNVYTEVYTILQNLNEEEYKKIPPEVIRAIETNRNEEYKYELEDNLELKEQTMLPETKAILFNLFRDYLSTPEQKNKIIQMQKKERQKSELRKKQLYNTKIFDNRTIEKTKKNEIIEYKEKLSKVNRTVKQALEQLNPDNSTNKTFTIPDNLINKENIESIININNNRRSNNIKLYVKNKYKKKIKKKEIKKQRAYTIF